MNEAKEEKEKMDECLHNSNITGLKWSSGSSTPNSILADNNLNDEDSV